MKQKIKKLKKKETLKQMENNCMLKVFYIISWKQLFQCKNGKKKHSIIEK